jgi:hypothetical protein
VIDFGQPGQLGFLDQLVWASALSTPATSASGFVTAA